MDYGKKYCKKSLSLDDEVLQNAILNSLRKAVGINKEVLQTLKLHTGMGLQAENESDEDPYLLQMQINEVDTDVNSVLGLISADITGEYNLRLEDLYLKKATLRERLEKLQESEIKNENTKSQLDKIYAVINSLQNQPFSYENDIIRQLIECVKVISATKLKVVYKFGLEMEIEM